MALGGVFILLSIPFFAEYFMRGKKKAWMRNLAIILLAIGLLIVLVGLVLYLIGFEPY